MHFYACEDLDELGGCLSPVWIPAAELSTHLNELTASEFSRMVWGDTEQIQEGFLSVILLFTVGLGFGLVLSQVRKLSR